MNLHVINTGYFKLDGGAMFGVVPKLLWQKLNPADDNNLCTWAMRCLLVATEDRLVLIDTGIGAKQSEKFFSHHYLHGTDSLTSSILAAGYTPNEVTDVILTHLHFDHVGGAVSKVSNKLQTTFPNATYWSNEQHWHWATSTPNAREKASFLHENIDPILQSGQLQFINPHAESPFAQIQFLWVDGHTEKQMLPIINYKGTKILYAADLIPSLGHLAIPYVMAYDVRPLQSMQEKADILKKCFQEQIYLFFEHDPQHELCSLQTNEKGITYQNTFTLSQLI